MDELDLIYYTNFINVSDYKNKTYLYTLFQSEEIFSEDWYPYLDETPNLFLFGEILKIVSLFDNLVEYSLLNLTLHNTICYIELSYFKLVYSVNGFVEQFTLLDNGYRFIGNSILSIKDLDITNYISYNLPFNWSFVYSLKFCSSLLFLIFIRAGLPRYRYDYLTKLGWAKFLLFTLFILMFVYFIFIFL